MRLQNGPRMKPESRTPMRKPVRRRERRLVTGPDEYGSTYVYFRGRNRTVQRTLKHLGLVNLDYDKTGRLVGVELLAVPWQLPL